MSESESESQTELVYFVADVAGVAGVADVTPFVNPYKEIEKGRVELHSGAWTINLFTLVIYSVLL
jgi:hypothetical protein